MLKSTAVQALDDDNDDGGDGDDDGDDGDGDDDHDDGVMMSQRQDINVIMSTLVAL